MARVFVATALTFSAACGAQTADPPGPAPTTTVAPPDPHPSSTTTIPPSVATATTGRPPARASGSQPVATAPPPAASTVPAGGAGGQGPEFWRELANCECASGHCGGGHVGWFQLSPDTAAKVGIDGSEGYEEQRAAAEEWARRIHPREATSAGWPHCWGVALARAA